jgi:hypothetical protein
MTPQLLKENARITQRTGGFFRDALHTARLLFSVGGLLRESRYRFL